MKKFTAFILVIVLAMSCFAACGTETPEETEPEVFVTSNIITAGTSDYVIVHDDTGDTKNLAIAIRNAIKSAFQIQLEIVGATEREESEKEIVLGKSREIAEKTSKKLKNEFDFALKVEENKLVLCATNTVSYTYLSEYVTREVFVKTEGNDLVLDSNDNMVYSDSSLKEMNYVQYMKKENKTFKLNDIFMRDKYRNADTMLPYRLYVPSNYSPEKQYPLLVVLHGAGHRGIDNDKHLLFIDKVLNMDNIGADEAIIIFPQCAPSNKWVDTDWAAGSYKLDQVPESNELRALMELIGQLREKYSVDSNRIYACGYSMGGYGTWNLLMLHPDVFCAGIAMCGAGDPTKASTLVDMPVWAIHGVKDPTVPVAGSREMVNAIKAAGGTKVHYTELPNNEHDVWTYTYSNQEIFSWLFSQKKA